MHHPLTRTSAPALDFSRPGTPAATDFGDIYFSTDGGLEETQAVFLNGCGLPERWKGREVYTIAELGFGSGLNFLATWQAWRDSEATGRLHFISVEGFPFERDDLARALSAFPELAEFARPLIDSWPGPVKGVHRRHFGNVTLTLIQDEIGPALAGQDFRADAWFLDGFSPAKNPEMWSETVVAEVARLSAPDARLATFTVAGAVRRALEAVGFEVERKEGFGRKRHRLEARRLGQATPYSAQRLPTIIGSGIAGASLARAFARRGLSPKVLYDPDHPAASANAAALIKPRLDLQDKPEARFFLSSFLYAREAYRDAVLQEGVSHLFKDEREAERMKRIVEHAPLGPDHLRWTTDRVEMDTALVIDPKIAREEFLRESEVNAEHINSLSDIDGPIILACGYGIRTLLPETSFRFARGQLTWTDGGGLNKATTYGGYALPLGEQILLGASHDRIEDHQAAFDIRAADDARNLEQARARGLNVGETATPHRTSVRVNSPDTLPRLMKLEPQDGRDIWLISGLGSRGFVFAPLLGEALVSLYLGEPSALSTQALERFARRI